MKEEQPINGLPKDWKWMKLNEIGIPSNSNIIPSKYADELFEVWSVPNFEKDEPEYLKGKEIGSNKNLVQEGDVLLCKINPRINRVWKVRQSKKLKQIASTEWIVVRNKEINPSFLLYQLQSQRIRNELLKDVSGVGGSLMRTRPNAVKNLTLSIPTIETQQLIVSKIEELFSELDKGTEELKTAQQQLKVYRQAVLKWAFEGKLTNEDVKDGELPEGWTWKKVDELKDNIPNAIGAGPFGTIFKAKDFRDSGIPIIFLRHVKPGNYNTKKPGFMDMKVWEELFQSYSVFGGELLITKLGEPPGDCAIYPKGIGPAMVTPDVIKLSVNESLVDSKYLMYYFNSELSRKALEDIAFGTTRLRITLPIFKKLPIPYCTKEEQEQIVQEIESRLSVCDKIEKTITDSLKQAEALRQSILKKAFEGKLL